MQLVSTGVITIVDVNDGVSVYAASVYLQQLTQPSTPAGGSFDFAAGTLTPPSGWSATQPSTTTSVTWMATYVFKAPTPNSTVTAGTWSVPVVVAVTGAPGNSARRCYCKSALASLASTPATISTGGASSFPPNDSWGTGTVWQATPPALAAGEMLYQSDGVYEVSTGNTVWNVPYLSSLKVGRLDAITANTGTLTVDESISSGQTAFDTGTGFWIEGGETPKFSLGSSTKGIKWDGSAFTVRGSVVATENLSANAATQGAKSTLTSPTSVASGSPYTTITGTVSLPAVASDADRGVIVFLFDVYLEPNSASKLRWWIKAQYSTDGGATWFDTNIAWNITLQADSTGLFQDVALIGYYGDKAGVNGNSIKFRLQAYHDGGSTRAVGSSPDGLCQLILFEMKR